LIDANAYISTLDLRQVKREALQIIAAKSETPVTAKSNSKTPILRPSTIQSANGNHPPAKASQ
jgi:hypothetical protein